MKPKINQNMKIIVIVGLVTVIALAGLLLLIAGNEERNNVPTDPDPTEAERADTSEETTQAPTEAGVSPEAQKLFNARVESIDDSVGVAKLLETMDLRKNVADYRVKLQTKRTPKYMHITFNKQIEEKEKMKLDEKMQKYVQQILALVQDADEVQWTYKVKMAGGKLKPVTESLSVKGTTPLVQTDIKAFGKSAKAFGELLSL